MDDFVAVDSCYGPFVINRHDTHQYEAISKTGVPHIGEEIAHILEVIQSLPDPLVVVDGGANAGLITIPVAQAIGATGGVVWSFEPQGRMHQALNHTISLHNLSNIRLHRLGLGSGPSTRYVPPIDYTRPRDFGDVVLQVSVTDSPVEIVSIDSLNLPGLGFLKLDVEKMELDALIGGFHTIHKFRPWCWVEFIRSDMGDLVDYFDTIGYHVYLADNANLLASPVPAAFPWLRPIP